MVRNNTEISQIIDFARKNLSKLEINDESLLEEMEQVLALAIFEEPYNSPFQKLLSSQHREKTARSVNDSLLKQLDIDPQSKVKNLIMIADSLQTILTENQIRYPKIEQFGVGKYAKDIEK